LALCEKYYANTHYLVRNSILKAICEILKQQKRSQSEGKTEYSASLQSLTSYLLRQAAQCGEKYDMNLELLSEVCVMISQSEISINYSEEICQSSTILIEMLKEKGGDALVKNIDVIRGNLAL